MNKDELLVILRSERGELDTLLDSVGIDRMESPGVSGFYSAKDVVAHLTAYEQALVRWLKEAKAGRVYIDSVLDQPDLDARNAIVHDASKNRGAQEVLRTFRETLDELEASVELLTDEELNDPELTAWFVAPRWQQKREVWQCIADDSYEHQEEHVPDLEHWLAENGPLA
jgi:hypothetical protein